MPHRSSDAVEAMVAMEDDRKASGPYVAGAHLFIKQHFTPAQQEKILSGLPADVRNALPTVKPSEWYPLHYAYEQLRGIYRAHEDPTAGLRAVEHCGRFIGDQAASTFLRLVMKILTLPLLANKWPDLWLRYHSFGGCYADASQVSQNKFIVVGPGYPFVHCIGVGWMQNVLHTMGKKNVVVESDVPADKVELPEIRWTARWG
jgi:hypothetical protein